MMARRRARKFAPAILNVSGAPNATCLLLRAAHFPESKEFDEEIMPGLKRRRGSSTKLPVFSIGSFILTEDEVQKRKRYLEITPDDERRLKEAHPILQKHTKAIIDRFYDYLLAHEHTRKMLEAPGLVDRLKVLQTKYFDELTGGEYGLSYFENRLRVGQVHHRIGLSPEWYMGAYLKYLHVASDVLSMAYARDYERFYQTMVSLTKLIYLDMGLSLDAYHYSAQEGLKKSNEEMKRLQAAKRQLTDMIVHDLQNPLTGIASALRVIEARGTPLSEGEHLALQEALRRCDDLAQMIMNVLQVSRAETGELQTYIENLDVAALAREVAGSFRLASEQDERLIILEATNPVPARSDQNLLRRILQNLLRNALRHTPRGTKIVVRADAVSDGRARLSVIDDGPGIPPEVQPLLFEPFGAAALRTAGRHVDTGLGLASCRISARALGAEITVESDGKRGSTFTLILP